MKPKNLVIAKKSAGRIGFNITPLVDIVFLLIIFFLVVFQFIESEALPVEVPQDCPHAHTPAQPLPPVTLSIVQPSSTDTVFAVGHEKISDPDYTELTTLLTEMLNDALADSDSGIVTLRIDRQIPYEKAQYGLAAIAHSDATEIRIATSKKTLSD